MSISIFAKKKIGIAIFSHSIALFSKPGYMCQRHFASTIEDALVMLLSFNEVERLILCPTPNCMLKAEVGYAAHRES